MKQLADVRMLRKTLSNSVVPPGLQALIEASLTSLGSEFFCQFLSPTFNERHFPLMLSKMMTLVLFEGFFEPSNCCWTCFNGWTTARFHRRNRLTFF